MATPTSITRKYASARAKAVRRLMDAHSEEYQRLYSEECGRLGLTNRDEDKAKEILRIMGYDIDSLKKR